MNHESLCLIFAVIATVVIVTFVSFANAVLLLYRYPVTVLQVWKSVITNTPRTLVEIMGDLVGQIVDKLAAQDAEELRYVAGKALGDVVKKLVR